MKDCVFCKIVSGKIPTKKIAENKEAIAFYDIHPSADMHVLIVPKKHINDFETISKKEASSIAGMISLAQSIIKKEKPSKYRVIINGGSFLEIGHLHWHLQGGNLTKHALQALIHDNS